ncbi:hypothetical protein [Streptomyces fungicidicus]|uniref:hypothetical protein n=1 Tax=Streptomyces fungicidicus TaxID=68203 RepID=UPI00367D425B
MANLQNAINKMVDDLAAVTGAPLNFTRRETVLSVRDIREAELVTASGERILVREVNGKTTLAIPNHTDAKLTLAELQALGETLVQMANRGREGTDPLLERVKATEAEFFRSKGVRDPWAGYSGREFS